MSGLLNGPWMGASHQKDQTVIGSLEVSAAFSLLLQGGERGSKRS